jgi:undecaprenyl-phosphate 4-deoxy-4-formamido-L-arabinose transferase
MITESLSIVVPVYNSQDSLPILVERLGVLLPALARQFEVILVNDSSRDGSGAVVDRACQDHEWVVGIHLMRNFGQHNALLCGIRNARFEMIVTMDDDLQNPPEEVPRLLEKLAEGFDVVYGYPQRESHGLLRDFASRITKLTLQAAMGVEVASRVSSFRAFRSRVREAFTEYRGAFVSVDVLLSWGTSRFAAIPVGNPPRTIGKSTYTVGKLVIHAMNLVTGFSTMPLQLASLVGFAFAFFGFGVLLFVLERYFTRGERVAGFPFLASCLSIFSGVQLFSIGIIGEYLARMHFRLLDKPSYVTRAISRKTGAAWLVEPGHGHSDQLPAGVRSSNAT